ncbi:MAG TPA: hypothetical protein VII90_01005 [Anaerolineales bacterium]
MDDGFSVMVAGPSSFLRETRRWKRRALAHGKGEFHLAVSQIGKVAVSLPQ